MEASTDLFEEIVRMRAAGLPAALCTVLLSKGSTPGKDAMKMLVRGDGTTHGSVGGGCVEHDAIQMALAVLQSDRAQTKSFRLNQKDLAESGLICGGQVTILAEPVVPPVLVLLGGGHVGAATARIAKEAGLRVMVCDPRSEFASPEVHPQADECFAGPWHQAIARIAPAHHHYLVVVTRGHKDDAEALRAIWAHGCKPKFLGMLGSKAKKATLDRLLADEGIDTAWLSAIRTPVGLPLGGSTSGEIAVSIVSELVQLRRLGQNIAPSDGQESGHQSLV
jgi:xanthine dehydrogenase accessory factor